MGCQNTPNNQVKYASYTHYFNTPLKPNPVPARVATLAVQRTRPGGIPSSSLQGQTVPNCLQKFYSIQKFHALADYVYLKGFTGTLENICNI